MSNFQKEKRCKSLGRPGAKARAGKAPSEIIAAFVAAALRKMREW